MSGQEIGDGFERAGLITARLMLRPPELGDAERIESLTRGNPRDDVADARAWMARARLSKDAVVFSIIEAASQSFIGAAGIAPLAGEPSAREMCLWVGETFAGRGYGTQAARAVIDHAFTSTAVTSLWFVCRSTNLRARRLIERCGFQQRESGMARSVALRAVVAVERYQLERRDWRGVGGIQLSGRGQHYAGNSSTH